MNKQGPSALFITFAILMMVSPTTHAVVPPPDGGYPGGNTAEGQNALLSVTTGGFNTAVGFLSESTVTIGQLNTAIGAGTLLATNGDSNTATGAGALLSNTTGSDNTANGAFSLFSNTIGTANTAVGFSALFNNTEASVNTAVGQRALHGNTTGEGNTGVGFGALQSNIVGSNNTAIGSLALADSTSSNNTALGERAGFNVTTAANVICIGTEGANVNGSCFVGNIRGVQTHNANAIPVLIDTAGQLGTTSSSRRFKKAITPMDEASEAILALKPVTFHYKNDNTDTPQFGLIAEEVAEVNSDLVVRDEKGQLYSVRYDAVNAMLLNEFLKEHRRVEHHEQRLRQQEATISELRSAMARQQTGMETVMAKIQKLSARLELAEPATRVVAENE